MPVTAKLSRMFYERFGDEIANELVEWFNSVDTAYRTELREFNELNFARFDAKVEQRFAEADTKLERRLAELRIELEERFVKTEARIDARAAASEARFDARFAASELKDDARFATIDVRLKEIDARFAKSESRMLKWMFSLWTGSMLGLAGFVFIILRAVRP
jgi:hypothetical protein